MNEQQARSAAAELLAERSEEFRAGEWVIIGAEEHETAWSFRYQSRSFVETGRITDSLVGNGPVVVPKSGERPWMAWSGRPVEEQIGTGRPPTG